MKNKWLAALLVGGVLALAFIGRKTSSADGAGAESSEPAMIRGLVLDAAGSPAPSAQVQLQASGVVKAETVSNAQGRFVFASIPSGTYAVVATLNGRQGAYGSFTLPGGITRQVLVQLP